MNSFGYKCNVNDVNIQIDIANFEIHIHFSFLSHAKNPLIGFHDNYKQSTAIIQSTSL